MYPPGMLRRWLLLALVTVLSSVTLAQTAAPAPPMGWNSWDAYGMTIDEAQFRANARVLHDKLLPFGWRYAVVDEGWYMRNPKDRPAPEKLIYQIDANGRYLPVPDRFPSALPGTPETTVQGQSVVDKTNRGFTDLANWVHQQGMLFGIHIVRGIPRESVRRNLPIDASSFHAVDAADKGDACPWDPTNWGVKDNAAGQAWYDSLIRQYAAWGVDLLKVDCISDHPYRVSEIRQIRRAIDKAAAKTGRPIVLSLSPGPTNPSHEAEVASLSNMWRISNDFWDVWAGKPGQDFPQPLKGQFDRLAAWSGFALQPGQWPDADMLPFGELRPVPGWGQPRHTRFTADEQKTVMSLWSLAQSPLILGANLTQLDEPTLRLLTNREVLRIDQEAVVRGIPVDSFRTGDLRVWRAEVRPTQRDGNPVIAVGIFNLGDSPMKVDRPLGELGLLRPGESGSAELFDVWANKNIGRTDRVRVTVPPHGCALFERR